MNSKEYEVLKEEERKMIEYGQIHENKKAENFADKIMKVFFG